MIARLKPYLAGDGLKARAGRGTLLTIVSFGGQNFMRLASNLILTRLLFPEAFGLMALVQVVTSGVGMFSDIGVNASVVQHARGDDPAFLRTAWTLKVIRGFVLGAIIALLAPFAASFYDEPMLLYLLPVAALNTIVEGFSTSKIMQAQRNLRLDRLTWIGFANQFVTLAITALLAWWLRSDWALPLGMIAGSLLRNFTLRVFLPGESDRFTWDRDAVRDIFGFGKFVLLGTFATFLVQNGDKAILGKYLGTEMLGIYSIAMTLALMPNLLGQKLGSAIFFPLYSRKPPRKSPQDRIKLFRMRYAVTSLLFLASMLLVLLGDPLVRLLYDERYAIAGPITVLSAIGLLPTLILASYRSVVLSAGQSGRHAALTSLNALLRIGALFLGLVHFGLAGALLAPAVATVLYYPFLILGIYSSRAWDPLHDLLFFVLGVGIALLGWWINADIISAALMQWA